MDRRSTARGAPLDSGDPLHVTLSSATAQKPTFTAPVITGRAAGAPLPARRDRRARTASDSAAGHGRHHPAREPGPDGQRRRRTRPTRPRTRSSRSPAPPRATSTPARRSTYAWTQVDPHGDPPLDPGPDQGHARRTPTAVQPDVHRAALRGVDDPEVPARRHRLASAQPSAPAFTTVQINANRAPTVGTPTVTPALAPGRHDGHGDGPGLGGRRRRRPGRRLHLPVGADRQRGQRRARRAARSANVTAHPGRRHAAQRDLHRPGVQRGQCDAVLPPDGERRLRRHGAVDEPDGRAHEHRADGAVRDPAEADGGDQQPRPTTRPSTRSTTARRSRSTRRRTRRRPSYTTDPDGTTGVHLPVAPRHDAPAGTRTARRTASSVAPRRQSTLAQPVFTMPTIGRRCFMRLTVTDQFGRRGDRSTSRINRPRRQHRPPTVTATGPTFVTRATTVCQLTGTATDPQTTASPAQTLSFQWTQVDASGALAAGRRPAARHAQQRRPRSRRRSTPRPTPGTVHFKLDRRPTVRPRSRRRRTMDDRARRPTTRRSPTPGPDQTGIAAGATVTLDGSGSSDPEGHTFTYAWTQVDDLGDPVTSGPTR